jgi:hypothetical protein
MNNRTPPGPSNPHCPISTKLTKDVFNRDRSLLLPFPNAFAVLADFADAVEGNGDDLSLNAEGE